MILCALMADSSQSRILGKVDGQILSVMPCDTVCDTVFVLMTGTEIEGDGGSWGTGGGGRERIYASVCGACFCDLAIEKYFLEIG